MPPAQLPFEQPHPLQAPPRLRALQAQGPVHRVRTATGDPAWLVTGYQAVRRLLDDPRLGRSHPDPLARIELRAVFSALPSRFPALRLAEPAGRLTVNCDTLTGGLARLPVTW